MDLTNVTALPIFIGSVSKWDLASQHGLKQGIRLEPTGDPGGGDVRADLPDSLYYQVPEIRELEVAGDITVTFSSDLNSAVTQPELDALATIVADNQAGAEITSASDDYTLLLTDAGKIIEVGKATAVALNVPENASVAFPVGTRIDIVQTDAGTVTVTPVGAAVVRVQADLTLDLNGQWAGASLYKRATDEWVIVGNLVAA